MTAALAAASVLAVFAAAWELAGSLSEQLHGSARGAFARFSGGTGSLTDAAERLRLPQRIDRCGLSGRLDPRAVVAAKFGCAVVGALVALVATPAVPLRLGIPIGAGFVVAGFVTPDALLERAARRRRARLVAALPDALDILAVGAASGRDPAGGLGEIAAESAGPLASELGRAVAEIEAGDPVAVAVARLRRRIGAPEIGALSATLERSRTYGSPLADQLHRQATALRRDARRRIEDAAARAAPKIQLVVALVLVPSVLLTIVAAILAHSDQLFAHL
jgi:tight adherence protein C